MFCQIYQCTMSDAACVSRQRNAASKAPAFCHKPGAGDPNCANCAQGKTVAAGISEEQVADYRGGLKAARQNARDLFFGNTRPGASQAAGADNHTDKPKDGREGDMQARGETKICCRKGCEHGGKPQPLENFYGDKKSKDGKHCYCKDCHREISKHRAAASKADASTPAPPSPAPESGQKPAAPPVPSPDWPNNVQRDLLAAISPPAARTVRGDFGRLSSLLAQEGSFSDADLLAIAELSASVAGTVRSYLELRAVFGDKQ